MTLERMHVVVINTDNGTQPYVQGAVVLADGCQVVWDVLLPA